MVSTGSPLKWSGTQQALPLNVNEEIAYTDEDDDSNLSQIAKLQNLNHLITELNINSEETSLLPFNEFKTNFKTLIEHYKSKSASKIQTFWRAKKKKLQIKNLQKIQAGFLRQKYFSRFAEKSQKFYLKRMVSVLRIQKAWRCNLKKRQNKIMNISPKCLLAQAVKIGGKLLKITSVIEKIRPHRKNSDPNQETPEKKKLILVSRMRKVRSSSTVDCMSSKLKESIIEDSNDLTIEVIPEISLMSMNLLEVSNRNIREISKKSLVMQKDSKVHTKQAKSLTYFELQKIFECDLAKNAPMEKFPKSVIPTITNPHKIYHINSIDEVKKVLFNEYLELINS